MDPMILVTGDDGSPNKKKVTASIVVGVLLLAIPLGVYLAQRTQVFSPRAASEPIPTDTPTALPTGSSSTSPTPSTDPGGKGDANDDDKIDLVDLSILLSNYNKPKTELDFNSDNVINSIDYATMLQALLSNGTIKELAQ